MRIYFVTAAGLEEIQYLSRSGLMARMEKHCDYFINSYMGVNGFCDSYENSFTFSIDTDDFGDEIHFVEVCPEDCKFNNDDLHVFTSREAAQQWMDAYQGSGELTYYSFSIGMVLEKLSIDEEYEMFYEESTERYILEELLDRNFDLMLKDVGYVPEEKEDFVNHFHGEHRDRVIAAFAKYGL